jgi:hypothetical protein
MHPGQESHLSSIGRMHRLEQGQRHVDTPIAPIEIRVVRRFHVAPQ